MPPFIGMPLDLPAPLPVIGMSLNLPLELPPPPPQKKGTALAQRVGRKIRALGKLLCTKPNVPPMFAQII
jgi:hypothetical protein